MSDQSWRELAIGVVALALMALAATLEASATLISRQRLRQTAEAHDRHRTVKALLDPRRSLTASLVLIEVVAIAVAASLLTTVALRELETAEHVLAIAVVAAVFLLFGQALPRALARSRPERAAVVLVRVAGFLSTLVRPLAATVDGAVRLLGRVLPGRWEEHPDPIGTEEELRAMAREDGDDGVIEADEREMIDNVLRLEETSASDIMVPRVDIVAVEESAPLREIVATITGAGHSRIPVYRESIDQIVGVLYAKDLLPFVIGTTEEVPMVHLLRPAFVVPESKRVDDLLTELRRSKVHIAIVADEYGGTAGLVTIEDILEEIVGEIHDEYDIERPLFERVGETELIADGRLAIEEVADALGLEFSDDDYGTVGGFVHHHLERLPRQGDRFDAEGLHVEVLDVEGHRLRRLRLVKLVGTGPTGGSTEHAGAKADAAPADRAATRAADAARP